MPCWSLLALVTRIANISYVWDFFVTRKLYNMSHWANWISTSLWKLAYTFALDDRWWPQPEFDLLWCPNMMLFQWLKNTFLKICTWWLLVTSTWFWSPMMPKIRTVSVIMNRRVPRNKKKSCAVCCGQRIPTKWWIRAIGSCFLNSIAIVTTFARRIDAEIM